MNKDFWPEYTPLLGVCSLLCNSHMELRLNFEVDVEAKGRFQKKKISGIFH